MSPNKHITLEDLHLCKTPQALANLFGRLGYTIESDLTPLPKEVVGFSTSDAAVIKRVFLLADQAELRTNGTGLQVILFELEEVALARLRSLATNFLNRGGNYLLVATTDYRRITFVNPRREGGRVRIRKLVVDTAHPTRHDLDILEGLAVLKRDPQALYQAQCEAFDIERVTNRFYYEYAELFKQVQKTLLEYNRGVKDFYDADKLHAFTQRLLGRVMFLHFIQKKGWLGGDSRFLVNQYRKSTQDEGNYYALVLEPLFFETLNKRRVNDESRWGRIPYLNGGLFEKDYSFILYLPNDLFDPTSDNGILGFFNNYNFTVAEDTPSEQEVAVDPEMLGKVFENMMESQERGKSGTFYTPRPIVHYMCRQALLGCLMDRTGLPRQLLLEQFEDEPDTALTIGEARHIEQVLDQVHVLDPAVGTGAFLVGVLHELVTLKRSCAQAKGVNVPRSSAQAAEWKRAFISKSLYGVDIKAEAVEIARLRLWLSLVVDLELQYVEPLPNLDYKLRIGNSLLEILEGERILIQTERLDGGAQTQQLGFDLGSTGQARSRLSELKESYFAAQEAPERQKLRAQVENQERALVLEALNSRIADLDTRIKSLVDKGSIINWKGMAREQKELERLTLQKSKLVDRHQEIRGGGVLPFLYHLHFYEVFREKDGFDLVLANPPYVNTKDTSSLDYLKDLEKQYGWADDLYAHFIFQGFNLARSGGWVAYITADTFFTISTKERVRELLQSKNLRYLIQCDPFEATVDAAIFVAQNCPAAAGSMLEFVQARAAAAQEFDSLIDSPAWTETLTARCEEQELDVPALIEANTRRYQIPVDVYRLALKKAFFEPSRQNLALYNRFTTPLKAMMTNWWDAVATSKKFSENKDAIRAYCQSLQPGDIVLVGMIGEGGQGMATGDNSRFLAHLEGSPEAVAILQRRAELQARWLADQKLAPPVHALLAKGMDFADLVDTLKCDFDPLNDLGLTRGEIYRVVPDDVVFDVSQLSEFERQRIIADGLNLPRCWIPYRKGDKAGNKWVSQDELFICWSQENVQWLWKNSGKTGQGMPVIRNAHLYLSPGVTWSDTANHACLKARLSPVCVFDVKSMRLTPLWLISPDYFLGLLNANLPGYFSKKFINNTAMYQIGDLRMLPLVIPTEQQKEELSSVARQAVAVQSAILTARRSGVAADNPELATNESRLVEIEAQVNQVVEEIYGVSGLGPFDEF